MAVHQTIPMDEDFEFSDLLTLNDRQSCSPDSTTSLGSDTSKNGSKPSPKRRSTEKRRQQALVASRNRRGAEAIAFDDLKQALPVTPDELKSLDKLGMLRVAAYYVKLRSVMERLPAGSSRMVPETSPEWLEPGALLHDGFLIIMSTDGDILYVPDGVSKTLRQEKHFILGTSIYDHIHKSSRPAIKHLLAVENVGKLMPAGGVPAGDRHTFKTPRTSVLIQLLGGIGDHLCHGTTVRITGKVFLNPDCEGASVGNCFIGLVEPVKTFDPFDCESPYPRHEIWGVVDFVCTLDLKCLSVDVKMSIPIHNHYHTEECRGTSIFEFIHPEDVNYVREGLKWMYKHGQVQAPNGYRMLIKNGGWAWFLTHASTMQVQQRNADGTVEQVTYCVGRHYMISDICEPGNVLAPIQQGLGALPIPHSRTAVRALAPLPALPALLPQPASEPASDSTPVAFDQSAQTGGVNLDLNLGLDLEMLNAIGVGVNVDMDADALMEEFAALSEEGYGFTPVEPVPQVSPILDVVRDSSTSPPALSESAYVESGAPGTSVRSQFPTLTSLLTR